MLTVDVLPSLVEQRQAALRALAGPRSDIPVTSALRTQVGSALNRLGAWIEGYSRDMVIGARVTGTRLSI